MHALNAARLTCLGHVAMMPDEPVVRCWRKTPDLGAPTSSYMWTSPDQALEPGGEFCGLTLGSCCLPKGWWAWVEWLAGHAPHDGMER